MRQCLISWLRGTAFVKRLVHLDDLKYHSARSRAVYEHFYHPEDPTRVDHWKEQHNMVVREFNEEKHWWMSSLKEI